MLFNVSWCWEGVSLQRCICMYIYIYFTAWLKHVWRFHVLKHNGWLAQHSTVCVCRCRVDVILIQCHLCHLKEICMFKLPLGIVCTIIFYLPFHTDLCVKVSFDGNLLHLGYIHNYILPRLGYTCFSTSSNPHQIRFPHTPHSRSSVWSIRGSSLHVHGLSDLQTFGCKSAEDPWDSTRCQCLFTDTWKNCMARGILRIWEAFWMGIKKQWTSFRRLHAGKATSLWSDAVDFVFPVFLNIKLLRERLGDGVQFQLPPSLLRHQSKS